MLSCRTPPSHTHTQNSKFKDCFRQDKTDKVANFCKCQNIVQTNARKLVLMKFKTSIIPRKYSGMVKSCAIVLPSYLEAFLKDLTPYYSRRSKRKRVRTFFKKWLQ